MEHRREPAPTAVRGAGGDGTPGATGTAGAAATATDGAAGGGEGTVEIDVAGGESGLESAAGGADR